MSRQSSRRFLRQAASSFGSLRARQGHLRLAALHSGAGPQAWGPPEWRSLQGLGPAVGDQACAAQACQGAERRPAPSRDIAAQCPAGQGMVQILSMIPIDGLDAVDAACAEALNEGAPAASVVINILARHREPPPPLTIDTPDALRLTCEPVADCKRYGSLRRPNHGKITGAGRVTPKACLRHDPAVNGGAKSGHWAEQKSASLGVTGALAKVVRI